LGVEVVEPFTVGLVATGNRAGAGGGGGGAAAFTGGWSLRLWEMSQVREEDEN
jgi:hypothetical protein